MGQSPKSKFYNIKMKGTPFLQGNATFGDKYPEIEKYTTKETKISNKNEVIMSVRAPVGDININPYKRVCIGRGLCSINLKNNKNQYLYYYLKANQKNIQSRGTGTVFSSINKSDIEDIKIFLPEDEEIDSYVIPLKTLDEKIENNKAIVSNLEKQIQAIFKAWFIDFEPFQDGEFVDSELGNIPKEWRVESLYNIANFKNGLVMRKYKAKETSSSLPVLKIRELRANRTDENSDRCNSNICKDVLVEDGDVIFSWSGSLLVKLWTGGSAGLNQHLFKVTSSKYQKWFYYCWLKQYLDKFIAIARDKATTMGHIKIVHLKEAKVLIPPQNIMKRMDELMSPIIKNIVNLGVENNKLSEIRDVLLPKLMSGEIKVT